MSDPATIEVLDGDARQEIKEAVCDAVIERVRRVVSGEGAFGAVILGDRPSRVLSSGFVLPGINADGDDETGDIHIASHGLDLRVSGTEGVVRVHPRMSVYVRSIPTSAELFAREGRLVPRSDFSPAAGDQAKLAIRTRADATIPQDTPRAERIRMRAAITRDVYAANGQVEVFPTGAQLPGGDDRGAGEDGGGDAVTPPPVVGGRLRIPDAISRRYEIPQKWARVTVDVPALDLPLPCDPADWAGRAAEHATLFRNAVNAAHATHGCAHLRALATLGVTSVRSRKPSGSQSDGMSFWRGRGRPLLTEAPSSRRSTLAFLHRPSQR